MNRSTKGFTLVEILIVVIILGILAAIVIPQFTQASDDARLSALQSDLQTVRSQLELYNVQHGNYPDMKYSAGAWAADTANFVARLTGTTDQYGDTTKTGYGPYLQKFPTNMFNTLDTVRVGGAAAGAGTSGWHFDTTTNKFSADDSAAHAAM